MPASTSFLLGWSALLAAVAGLFLVLLLAAWWQHRREVPSRSRRRALRAEAGQQATVLTERARQAAVRGARLHDELVVAEQAASVAWQELEQAQSRHDEAVQRYQQARRRSAGQRLDRANQQQVAHAALAAYRRGDLSSEQLWRVWSWGTGGDPELAEREQELRRLRVTRWKAHSRYRQAAGRARAALTAAEVAEVEARALAEEAATAVDEAGMGRWFR